MRSAPDVSEREAEPVGSGAGAAHQQDEDEKQDQAAADARARGSPAKAKAILQPVENGGDERQSEESPQASGSSVHLRYLLLLKENVKGSLCLP
jgi:hypothetical protein